MADRDDPSGTHLHLVLMKAHRVLARHATESVAEMGLGFSDFTILEALLHKGPQLVNDIGRRIQLTSGATTTAVDRLEARGLVERAAHERDGRARVVTLTAAGRALIAKAFAAHARRMDATAAALTKAERKALLALLKKLGYGAAELLEEEQQQVAGGGVAIRRGSAGGRDRRAGRATRRRAG
jgi:MarR family 2-MHQ and catechol resistance regulon transcriptional repressor